MRLRIRRSICLSRNNFSRRPSGACGMDRGYALLVLMMMATILLVSLTVALPSVYLEGQREREEELIFRGNEYARAIALFHRQFNRFPRTVEDLLRTNGIRFLRHAYKDPMKEGDGAGVFVPAEDELLFALALAFKVNARQCHGEGDEQDCGHHHQDQQRVAAVHAARAGGATRKVIARKADRPSDAKSHLQSEWISA